MSSLIPILNGRTISPSAEGRTAIGPVNKAFTALAAPNEYRSTLIGPREAFHGLRGFELLPLIHPALDALELTEIRWIVEERFAFRLVKPHIKAPKIEVFEALDEVLVSKFVVVPRLADICEIERRRAGSPA